MCIRDSSNATLVLSSHASQPDATLTSRQKASLRLATKLNPSKGGSTTQKDEKRAVLPARVTFDGAFDKFEEFRHKIQGHLHRLVLPTYSRVRFKRRT